MDMSKSEISFHVTAYNFHKARMDEHKNVVKAYQDKCKHENREIVSEWKNGYELRTARDYHCPDCLKNWSSYLVIDKGGIDMAIKVCIDPGHGGYDPGATNGDVHEADINLIIGLQLRDILEKAGFSVEITRTSDVSPSGDNVKSHELAKRVEISDNFDADVFVSIHVNAGGGVGAEIYVYKDGGNLRPLAQKVIDNVGDYMGYHGTPIKDGSGLYVIANTKASAMLLEIGFIDSSDLQKINAYINDFAVSIAKAFCAEYDVSYPSETAPIPSPTDDWKVNGLKWLQDNLGVSKSWKETDPIDMGTLGAILSRLK